MTANIFEDDPQLLAGVSDAVAPSIVEMGEARVLASPPGDVDLALGHSDGFGLLVLGGFLCRQAAVTGRASIEVLGHGDLLRPWEDDGPEALLPLDAAHRALTPVRLALLDRDFAQGVAPWPDVAAAICRRSVERARRLALQLALTRLRRIEDRLHLLLWHLAHRWGQVEPDGTAICSIPLTHDLLAGMIGAQRPTVTSAMVRLVADGLIARHSDGWILYGAPPTASELEGRTLADAFRLRPEEG
jgi:CRP-like cAMP-binding protein